MVFFFSWWQSIIQRGRRWAESKRCQTQDGRPKEQVGGRNSSIAGFLVILVKLFVLSMTSRWMHVNSQREIPLFLPPASKGWGTNVSSLSVHRKVPRSLVPGPFWGYPSLWSCPGWGYLKARTGVRPHQDRGTSLSHHKEPAWLVGAGSVPLAFSRTFLYYMKSRYGRTQLKYL